MARPREMRIPFSVPVRVIGLNPDGTAYTKTAYTCDVSHHGVCLRGADFLGHRGNQVTLQYSGRHSRYSIAWVAPSSSSSETQAGLVLLEGGVCLWEADAALLEQTPSQPAKEKDPSTPVAAASSLANTSLRNDSHPATQFNPPRLRGDASRSVPVSSPPPAAVSQTSDAAIDNRANERFACDRGVLCWRQGGLVPLWGKLRNVSAGGCYVDTELPLEVGTPVAVLMILRGRKIRVHGEVRSCEPKKGMGICFTAITERDLNQLQTSLESYAVAANHAPPADDSGEETLQRLQTWFERHAQLSREEFLRMLSKTRKDCVGTPA